MPSELKKTKIPSVYKSELKNGDVSYYVKFRNGSSKVLPVKVGKKSEGMTELKALEALEKLKRASKNVFKEATILPKYISFKDMCHQYLNAKEKEVKMEEHLDAKNKKLKTAKNLRTDKNRINFWVNFAGFEGSFKKVKPEHIEDYIASARKQDGKPYAPKSMKLNIDIAVTVTKFCKYPNEENPFLFIDKKLIPKKKSFKRRNDYLNTRECEVLLEKLQEKEDKRDFTICLLCLMSGARPDSIMKIQVKDLLFSQNRINLYDFKRKIFYKSLFDDFSQEKVKEFLGERIHNYDDYVFQNEKGEPYFKFPVSISRVLDSLFNYNEEGKQIRQEKIVPYSLRHTFACLLINEVKMPIYEVSKLLNHASVNTTVENYITHDLEKSREAFENYAYLITGKLF